MRIVCDTNVLVSGLLFGGSSRAVLKLVSEGRVDGYTSNVLTAELEQVLLRPTFGLTASQVEAIIDLVRQTFRPVCPAESVTTVTADPDDNHVLEVALAAQADAVVSGDDHLLELRTFQRVRIVPPARFLAEFAGPGAVSGGRGP